MTSLWRHHVLPFALLLGLLAAATLAGDYLLHRLNLVWVGRYLGIPGTLLIMASLAYSLRKRKYIASGNLKSMLKFHEIAAWLGSWMVLLHAGIHFNAILPWLATAAMGVNVVSGMVGKLLLERSRRHVQAQRERFQLRGLSRVAVDDAVFWDAVTLDAMAKWRKIHIPIFFIFVILGLGHIVSIFLFWGWS
ncbi:MAG: hypothetical protein Q7T36_16005 [Fluviicoccus sp.]|uniref:hypothetical protein n=1 Tax=Fluviicoccus sp. TaxID=2003552 RepID=UPI0027223FED|nr:hypothetical protein [Fluviicoccus sp.]MDO8331969.1 hypothetical protein [Fluviicoccus sp.]